MRFEHLIEINDFMNPLITPLTLAQLWQGLVLRAESPQLFQPQIDQVNLLERGENWLERELHFGQLVVRDRILFEPMVRIEYQTAANDQHDGGSLIMQIEMPEPEQLFVRFTYTTSLSETATSNGVNLASYVRNAYQQNDMDTISIIREMAEQGSLPTDVLDPDAIRH